MLNLFAYTGGATLAAAAEGAAVTHVDASRPAVAWARRNAELSGPGRSPRALDRRRRARLRRAGRHVAAGGTTAWSWIRRATATGRSGERWTLIEQLPLLLDACLRSSSTAGASSLLTAHAEGLQAMDLGDALADAFVRADRRADAARIEAGAPELVAASGGRAPAGVYARRWQGGAKS